VSAVDTSSMSRRRFLAVAGAAAGAVGLAGCGGFSTGGDSAAADPDTLKFTLWGQDSEIAAFKALADKFKQQENVTVQINNVPFSEVRQNVDAGLQSGRAPDLFRVTYNDLGIYASQNALLELDQYLPGGYADAFTPALWKAVTPTGKVVGVPHHTDTSMILYNKDAMAAAGVTPPTTPDAAWTQEQFLEVARKIKGKAGTKYAFGVNWQKAGAYRWLNWVSQQGGRLLSEDLKSAAIDSDQGRAALKLTQSFFTEGLVPPTTSTKGTYVDEIFPSGTIAMVFAGDFLLSGLQPLVKKFEYGATFLPVGTRAAADLGGNAVVATKDAKNKEAAAKFLQFLADETNMADFCAKTNVLPTRTALAGKDLSFADRPDLMKLYVQQAQSINPDDVAQVTVPTFSAINNVLVEQLERAFVSKTDAAKVAADLSGQIDKQLK
jgi:multiple sugar transport system substrate-binding protein